MSHETIQIRTNDGVCPTHVLEPDEDGRWPAVLMFMDGLGIRPALFNIAERLSSNGYSVMLPDLYYRSGYSASDAATLFSDDAVRKDWASRVLPTVSIEKIMQDMPFFLAHLDAALVVRRGKIGTTGYCLGAAFHSRRLVTFRLALVRQHRTTEAGLQPTTLTGRIARRPK
jgi:carboxymethylenebutenolidase